MGGLAIVLLLASGSAIAHQPSARGNTGGEVIVRAPERLVCRPVIRTGTRMRTSAVCRTRTEWVSEQGRAGDGSYWTIEEASAKLSIISDSCTPGPQGCD